jgi:hypothetical protein
VNARNIAASLFAVLAAAAHSAEPPSLESLAAPLLQAQTYCESGTGGADVGLEQLTQNPYRVCAHRDGRFKFIERPGMPGQIVMWSDGRKLHRYVEHGRGYQQYDLADRSGAHLYERPREEAPALHSRLFRSATRSGAGLDLLGSLRGYRVNAELSDARQTVYERTETDGRAGSRIRVKDGAIVRYEYLWHGILRGYVEIASREVDRPLADAELAQDVPVWVRYSLENNQPVFAAGLFVLAALAGLAFWAWRFARAEHPYDVLSFRRYLWRIYAWAFGGVAAILGMLAFLTWGGKGHPPAIVFVIALAGLAGLAFGLVACFLLSSYVVQAFPRNRIARVTPD